MKRQLWATAAVCGLLAWLPTPAVAKGELSGLLESDTPDTKPAPRATATKPRTDKTTTPSRRHSLTITTPAIAVPAKPVPTIGNHESAAPAAASPPAIDTPTSRTVPTPVITTNSALPTPDHAKAGDTLQDCADCPVLVVIPSGQFLMGSAKGTGYSDEYPQHAVTLPAPLAVGRFEVTFAEWDACVRQDGCAHYRPADMGWGRDQRPVINVSWQDAQNYVQWLREKTGRPYRLLSEAEWEYAARAGSDHLFGAENCLRTDAANFSSSTPSDLLCPPQGTSKDFGRTQPAGSFAANAFGLQDMAGNVWEWVEDC